MKDKYTASAGTAVGIAEDNFDSYSKECEWSYLRENLDNPGYLNRHFKEQAKGKSLGMELLHRLLRRWQPAMARPARLAVIARIVLGPRQAVALVEADGVQLLVATSADCTPSFFPLNFASHSKHSSSVETSTSSAHNAIALDEPVRSTQSQAGRRARRIGLQGRVSW